MAEETIPAELIDKDGNLVPNPFMDKDGNLVPNPDLFPEFRNLEPYKAP